MERLRENAILCKAGCIICILAPCIEPCLYCCPAGDPIKILPQQMDRPECLDDIKIPNPAFPYGKVNWEHDDLACRDWALGRDMAKWEEKYNPQPEPEPEPEPEDLSKLTFYERRKRAIEAGVELGANEGATDAQVMSG